MSARLSAAAVLILAAALSSCRGAGYWQARLRQDPLYARGEQLRAAPSCAASVPMEYGRSLPVPSLAGGLLYKTFFYPIAGGFGQAEAGAPAFAGVFAPDSPAFDRCSALASAVSSPRGPAVPAGLSMAAYYRAQARYFEALGRIGPLYAAGGQDKKAALDFLKAFRAAAEPGMRADYYGLSPAFWEWLRGQAGDSIPKPS